MKQVLVVDDDDGILEMTRDILLTIPCSVMVIANSADAFNMCNLRHFDGVITDRDMPGMSGIELARRLRHELAAEEGPKWIVLITGDQTDDLDAETRGLFTAILHKPFLIHELTRCVGA